MGGLEVLVKGEQLTGHAGPEGVGIADGLLIELLVLVEVLQMSARGVFVVESFRDVVSVHLVGFQHLFNSRCVRMARFLSHFSLAVCATAQLGKDSTRGLTTDGLASGIVARLWTHSRYNANQGSFKANLAISRIEVSRRIRQGPSGIDKLVNKYNTGLEGGGDVLAIQC